MIGKDDKNLPYDLENLSVPELEALLQRDFLASDGSSSDVDYIMAIVEVIHKKEQARPGYQPLDSEQAWEEFKSFYIMEDGRANSIYRSDEEDDENIFHSEAEIQTPGHKKCKIFRRCLLAAISLSLLVALTAIPVFGYHSIVQMFARWTAEQFGFYMPSEIEPDSEQVPEEFEELQEIMQQLGVELIVPKFPEGFEKRNSTLSYLPDDNILEFSIIYQRESDYYIFTIGQDKNILAHRHEKSDSLVDTKVYNGIKHYYFENNGSSTVVWYINTIEFYIVTNRTTSDLKEIIETTYNE